MEHFDDIFKKKLESYDSGKPEHLWEGIQQELQRQSVSPFSQWIWGYISAGAIVLAGITAYFVYQLPQKPVVEISRDAMLPTDDQAIAMPEMSAAAEDQMISEESAADLASAVSPTSKPGYSSRKKTVKDSENSSGNPTVSAGNITTTPRFNWDWNPDIDAIVKAMEIAEKEATAAAKVTDPNVEKTGEEVKTVIAPQKSVIGFTPALANELDLLPGLNDRIPTSAELNLKMCYSFNKNCKRLYFEPYVAATYAAISLKPRDSESADYMAARLDTEKPVLAPAFGGRVSLVSCGGVAIRAGLSYQMNTFRFDYTDGSALQNSTINILVDTIFPSVGDTIFVWDTLSVVQHGTLIKKTFNHFRSIDIPLLAGYELETYKWIFSVNGGAIFNIVSWQKGDILNPALDPVSITTGSKDQYKAFRTNTGISLTANLGFYYKLPNHSQILIEPYFRYPLKSVAIDDYPLEEKHLTGGIRVGLRLPLGR